MRASPDARPLSLRDRLVLTKRDLDVLRAAERHRFIRTDHFQALFFHGERAAQARLRQRRGFPYRSRFPRA